MITQIRALLRRLTPEPVLCTYRHLRAAALTVDYHRLEKGMTLREPRLGYASAWISTRFIRNPHRYVDLCGVPDDLAVFP